MSDQSLLLAMQFAAIEAGKILRGTNVAKLAIEKKGDVKNIVTQADKKSEACIVEILSQYPNYSISAEEGTNLMGTDGQFYVDPLDGTIPFVMGMPTYGISIGLVEQNVPTHGVLYYPTDGDLIYANRGDLVNRPMETATRSTKLHDLVVGFDYSLGMDRELQVGAYYLPLVNATRYVLSFACVTWACRQIFDGKLDAYVHPGATRYDWAAAACILQEAGAVVCDFDGKPLDFSRSRVPAIAARNQKIMDTILNIYKH
jgi:myo-inositol-1(or 4)-monophosphatase